MSLWLIGGLIGIAAGVSSGLFGIGGGVVIIPMLVLFLSYTQQAATGTSLIALLLPVGALGVWQYFKAGYITIDNVKVGLMISVGMFFGTLLGAKIGVSLNSEIMTKAFAVFLVLVSIRLWFFSAH